MPEVNPCPYNRQHGSKAKQGGNLTGASAGGLGPQRGPALAQQWRPSGFQPHWAAEPLPKHPATSQSPAPKLLSVSAWLQACTSG